MWKFFISSYGNAVKYLTNILDGSSLLFWLIQHLQYRWLAMCFLSVLQCLGKPYFSQYVNTFCIVIECCCFLKIIFFVLVAVVFYSVYYYYLYKGILKQKWLMKRSVSSKHFQLINSHLIFLESWAHGWASHKLIVSRIVSS